MNKMLKSNSVFGLFDGVTAIMGVLVALVSKGSSAILLAAIGLAIAEAVGMGAGEFLSDSDTGIKGSAAIGLGAVAGILAPVIPWLFVHGSVALISSIMIALLIGILIGKLRSKGLRGYIESLGVLLLAGGLTTIFTLITGS